MAIRHVGYLIISRQLDSLFHEPRLLWSVAALVLLIAVFVFAVARKSRPFAPGDVFRASRLSAGNRLFPTQVLISPTSVIYYTPQWFGRLEHSIHMAHV